MQLVAPVDFRPLGQLGQTFDQAFQQGNRRRVLASLGDLNNPEALIQAGTQLARAGDMEQGVSLATLWRTLQTEQRQREADQRAFEMLSGGGERPQTQSGGLFGAVRAPVSTAPASSGPFAPVQSPGDPSLPAGMRNNNPGNIKFVPGVMRSHTGAVGPSVNTDQGDPQTVFETPELGMQGMYRLAMRRYEGGRLTPTQLIAEQGGWTPGNTAAAQNVARMMGIGPNDDMRLTDPRMAQRFMRALTMQEHGLASRAYGDDMIADQIQIVNEQRSGQRPFTPGPTGYGGEIARMAGVQGGAPVQVASAGAFTPASMPQGMQGGGQQVAQAGGMPQQQAAPQQEAQASPQMGDAMMRARRIEDALRIPGLSPAARQQLTAQLAAITPLIGAERQAMAPTPAMREYELSVRQGFRGTFQDYQRQVAQGGPEGGSLTPTWGIDAQGRPVALQARRDGTMGPFTMPEGVSIARDPIRVDTPTGTVLLDPQTRQQVGFVPKDIAGAAVAQAVGQEAGTQIANAPQAARNGAILVGQIDAVLTHPSLENATGPIGMLLTRIPGTPAYGVQQRIEQLRGQAFLQAFDNLRGSGAISNTEGQTATQAIARLNNAQSMQDFTQALRELRDIADGARQRAQARIPANNAATPTNAQPPGAQQSQPQGQQSEMSAQDAARAELRRRGLIQ